MSLQISLAEIFYWRTLLHTQNNALIQNNLIASLTDLSRFLSNVLELNSAVVDYL